MYFNSFHDIGLPGNEGPIGAKGHAGESGQIFQMNLPLLFSVSYLNITVEKSRIFSEKKILKVQKKITNHFIPNSQVEAHIYSIKISQQQVHRDCPDKKEALVILVFLDQQVCHFYLKQHQKYLIAFPAGIFLTDYFD